MFTFHPDTGGVRRRYRPLRLAIDAVVAMVIRIVIQLRILHGALLRGRRANKGNVILELLVWFCFFVLTRKKNDNSHSGDR